MKKILTMSVVLFASVFGVRALVHAAASDHLYEDLVVETILRGETGTETPCGECEQTFTSAATRVEHIYKTHCSKSGGTYQCSYGDCSKTFTCSCQIRPHIRKLHTVTKLIEL